MRCVSSKWFFKEAGLSLFFISFSITLYSQSATYNWQNLFKQSYYHSFEGLPPLRNYWIALSSSGKINDLQPLSYGLDAILAIFETTDSLPYLNDAITITDNVINGAQIMKDIPGNQSPFKDTFRGWIDTVSADKGLFHQEVPLSESYFFQYVAKLLLIIHNDPNIRYIPEYNDFYNKTLGFIETDIWEKWEERGLSYEKDKYIYLFRLRTHMASHWAFIAADLSFLTLDSSKKKDYLNFVDLYNRMLERNFRKYGNYISWNSTWNYNLNGSLNREKPEIQDVSHANLVISYIVEAYDLGLWKDTDAVKKIIATLKYKLWNPTDYSFIDNMDGTMFQQGKPHSSGGSFQADGFVKLTRYDSSLFSVYEKFMSKNPLFTAWHQYGQIFANLALSQKIYGKYKL